MSRACRVSTPKSDITGRKEWTKPLTLVERLRLTLAMVEADARDGDIDGAVSALRSAEKLIQQMPMDESYG